MIASFVGVYEFETYDSALRIIDSFDPQFY